MITIDNGQTHVVDTPVVDSYVVRDGSLEVRSGGSIIAPAGTAGIEMNGTGTATVTISGGQVRGGDSSTSGGGAGILMNAQSGMNILTITGGLVSGGFGGTSGGSGLIVASDSPEASNRVIITGGSVLGGGGGSIGMGIHIMNGCEVMVSGGTIGSPNGVTIAVIQQDESSPPSVAIGGGTILGDTTIMMQVAQDTVAITVSGGTFNTQWELVSGRTVVRGTGLALANGNLTGTLASGDAIDVPVSVQNDAQVILQSS